MQNRRNFYRILQVQPDAPQEVIRSTYRTLMQTLKLHPDLGGDTELASVINEAYNTLSDPKKREAYDAQLKQQYAMSSLSGFPGSGGSAIPSYCPFCQYPTAQNGTRTGDPHCQRCASPLTPCDRINKTARRMTRIVLDAPVMLQARFDAPGVLCDLRDWSPTGLACICETPYLENQVLNFSCAYFNSVGQVKYCRPIATHPPAYQIGIQFMTLALPQDRGNFVDRAI